MFSRMIATAVAALVVIGHSQSISPVSTDAIRVGSVKPGTLGNLIAQISENTRVGFCIETRDDAKDVSLASQTIDLNVEPNEDLKAVLIRMERSYPGITWMTEAGVVILSSKNIKDDPLEATIKPGSFHGTVRDFVAYMNSAAPGLMADTLEISGMYDRTAVYDFDFESEIKVREALSSLTRKYGVRWTARIRDHGRLVEVPGGTGSNRAGGRTGRVTLIFSGGPIPLPVR